MKRQSLHGGIWLDSSSPRLAQKSCRRAVLMSSVVMDVVYSLQLNACSFLNRSVDSPQDCPSSRNTSCQCSDLMSFNAPSFPRPAKALTVSHPLYACMPIRAVQTLYPKAWRSLVMSRYLTLFFVPHFWNKGQEISAENARHSTNISVSSAVITTAL